MKVLIFSEVSKSLKRVSHIFRTHDYEFIAEPSRDETIRSISFDTRIDLVYMIVTTTDGLKEKSLSQEIIENRNVPIVFELANENETIISELKKVSDYGFLLSNVSSFQLLETVDKATKLHRLETQKEGSQKKYSALFYNSHSPMMLIRPNTGQIVDVNRAACDFYGRDKKEFTSKKIQQINQLTETEVLEEMRQARLENRDQFYFKHETADGVIKDVKVSSSPVQIDGQTFLFSIITDISKQREAEQELKQSEEKYKAMYTNAPLPYQSLDEEGRFIDVNPAWLNTLGYSKDEVIGSYYIDFLHPSWKPHFEKNFPEFKKKGYVHDVQFKIKHKSGDYKDITFEGCIGYKPDGSVRQTYCVFKDITVQKKTEEELQRSEENLKVTLNSIGDAVIATDIYGKIVRMNLIAEEMTGYKLENCMGKSLGKVFNIINGLTRQKAENPVQRVLNTGRIVGLANYTILISADGNEYHIADSAAPIKDKEDKIIGVVLIFRDYTNEYLNNRKIKESENFLEGVFTSIQDGISVLNTDFTIRHVNPTIEKWFVNQLPLVGNKCYEKYHNRKEPCTDCPSIKCIESGVTETAIIPGVSNNNSEIQWFELYSYPLKDMETGEVTGIIEFVRDISEKMKRDNELKESVKEKEILIKEIHHRVKNNLNIVVSLLKLQKDEINSVDKAKQAFDESMNRLMSMALIHESLYRKDTLSQVEMSSYIKDMLSQIEYSFSDVGYINFIYDLDTVYLDITKAVPCGIIINELITNAIVHAFSGIEDKQLIIGLKRSKNVVRLIVGDNGCGLPTDFDIKKSSSLGMSLVNILTEQIDGNVLIERNEGTSFTIEFETDD